jgi:hypothetical protein
MNKALIKRLDTSPSMEAGSRPTPALTVRRSSVAAKRPVTFTA